MQKNIRYRIPSITDTNKEKKIFIVESGFNLYLRREYGCSRSGASINLPTIRGKNSTLWAAINSRGIVHSKLFIGACTSVIFSEFLIELDAIVSVGLGYTDAVYYMGNASVHSSEITQHRISELTSKVVFLSPYSYMLYPIVFAFSKTKLCVRSYLANMEVQLDAAVHQHCKK